MSAKPTPGRHQVDVNRDGKGMSLPKGLT